MAEDPNVREPTLNSEDNAENKSLDNSIVEKTRRSLIEFRDISNRNEPNMTLHSVPDDSSSCRHSDEACEQLSSQAVGACQKADDALESKYTSPSRGQDSKGHSLNNKEDKENTAVPPTAITLGMLSAVRACCQCDSG